MPLHEGWKKGDLIEAGRWLKKMGHVTMRPGEKPRNAVALVKKGKFVLALVVEDHDEADTVVNYDESITAFKRIDLQTKVKYDEDRITVFPADFWKKATTKNLFLGNLKRNQDDDPFEDSNIIKGKFNNET